MTMLLILIFLSLWTLVQGAVLAIVTTTVPANAIQSSKTAIASLPPSPTIVQSACIFTPTTDSSGETASICQCSSTIIAGINLAVSGSVTTSYCALGGPAPTGFSQLPAGNGQAIPTLAGNSSSCGNSTKSAGVGGTSLTVVATETTTESPFTTLTGSAKATSAEAITTRSGAFKHGVGMGIGLLTTTLVAVFLL